MKHLTLSLLLSLSVMLSGCDPTKHTTTAWMITSTGRCSDGERQYYYDGAEGCGEFYAPCDAYHVGDRLFTDSLTTNQ